MIMVKISYPRSIPLVALSVVALLLAGCSDGGDPGEAETIELAFAHSYGTDHPHHRCGAQLVADSINEQDIGLTINVFPNSQLGADTDRFNSVISGDIDMDIQGSSALGASYEPVGVLDTAYAFDGPDHLFEFFAGDAAEQLKEDFREATNARVLSVWYFGMRHFTANRPIRTPEDLDGLRMRFPGSPTYLANAEAMGATATAVAFEEVFISLQQGVIDGQENPLPTIDSMNLTEVQTHVSLSGHQAGSQLIVVSEDSWNRLSADQQEALASVVTEVQSENRSCIEQAEQDLLDTWTQTGEITVVGDVDRAVFAQRAEAYFNSQLTGESLALYQAIRASAP
jgi:tripartite ATP-independent transporter DctP family solute receptor